MSWSNENKNRSSRLGAKFIENKKKLICFKVVPKRLSLFQTMCHQNASICMGFH